MHTVDSSSCVRGAHLPCNARQSKWTHSSIFNAKARTSRRFYYGFKGWVPLNPYFSIRGFIFMAWASVAMWIGAMQPWGRGEAESIDIARDTGSQSNWSASTVFTPAETPPPSSIYASIPVGPHRPSGQYYTPPEQAPVMALITIITPTYNPRAEIFRAARFVQEQSLQAYRWIIVNDHSDDPSSIRRLDHLRHLAKREWRVRVVDNMGPRGGPSAMNLGVTLVHTPYVAILDDDDLWELNALEKAVLVMSWVPDAYAVGFDVINHGDKEFIWTRGFHNGDENFFFENGLVQGSPMRSKVFETCKFDTDFAGGAADWNLWMCMASRGMWGLHVPENGTWYQVNPASFRQQRWKNLGSANNVANVHTRIMRKYEHTLGNEADWPTVMPAPLNASRIAWGPPPFENTIAPAEPRRILMILTSLKQDAVLTEMLRYSQSLAKDGWRITILLTHVSNDDGGMRDMFMQHTHDIFVAPLVAPVNQIPRLINYIVESRRIDVLIVSHSKIGYAILPALAAHAPDVIRVDFVGQCNATAHLVARESVGVDHLLDLTLVPTAEVFDCVVAHGKSPDKVAISRGGDVDLCACGPTDRQETIKQHASLGLAPHHVLIAIAPVPDEAVAVMLLEALEIVLRKLTAGTSDAYRVFWPSVPLDVNVSGMYGGRVAKSWRMPEPSEDVMPDPLTVADVIITLNNPCPQFHIEALACRGATVLTNCAPVVDEPDWDWGHGLISTTPELSSRAHIARYARHIERALSQPRYNNSHGGVKTRSSDASAKLTRGQVACTGEQALHRAWNRREGEDPMVKGGVEQMNALRSVIKTIAEETQTRPSLFDMRSIQRGLQFRKARVGYGHTLQRKCPERIYRNTAWIDALESPMACAGGTVDFARLRNAAFAQCGAYCIANVEPNMELLPHGWALQGTCWAAVVSRSHPCMQHFAHFVGSQNT